MCKYFKDKDDDKIVNKYKLIYIPLIISIFAIASTSLMSYHIAKNMLIERVKSNGIRLTEQVSKQIYGNRASLEAMEEALEEKIKISSEMIISERDNLSEEKLEKLQKQLDVDEIHWIDSDGKTIYSTYEGYKNWSVPEGHPLDTFSKSDSDFMVESVRPNAIFGIMTKYGAMKDDDGTYVQIGIRAENIDTLTKEFSYQKTVSDLGDEENVEYAYILDSELKTLADSKEERVGTVYKGYDELEEGISGGVVLNEVKDMDSGTRIMEVIYPINTLDGERELAVVGFSMEKVYNSIDEMMKYSVIITLVMAGIILWIQNRNIIVPVRVLHDDIHKIDLEKNMSYRLPLIKRDTFNGIVHSINAILDNTSDYFNEIEKNRRDLNESKEIISSAYQQLRASEEELRAQYDEIQDYTEKLEDLKRKYEIAIEGTNSAVWEIDANEETMYFSREFENIIGKSVDSKNSLENTIGSIFGESSKQKFMQEYNMYRSGKKKEIYVQLDYEEDFERKKLLLQGKGIYREGELKALSGIVLDITKLKEQEDYIEYLAYHDFLTGLPNRRTFIKELEYDISSNKAGAVILLDLDNFKEINDTMGHIYGDKILRKVAEKLRELKIENSYISRFGGDEFLIMISGETDVEVISKYAEKIIDIFKKDIDVSGESHFISCSIGITLYPEDGDESGKLIMNADMAMYNIKNDGKGNYCFFDRNMVVEVQKKVDIERQMREAIENKGFKLLYQPQVDVMTGEVTGFEALVRMKDKFISPGDFIPIAEEGDLILDLGRYVTEEAIRQVGEWKAKGFSGKTVSLNFSAKQLKDSGYTKFFKDRLIHYGVDPEDIEIEVTESVFLEKKDRPMKFLEEIKSIGSRVALDDFGTGYSSFSYLTFLPVDKIKLDKSLSDRFLELENIGVMDSLISLAHSLNLEVVAEGVEDMEQYEKLKKGKCDSIQGFLFSRPLEKEDAEKLYNKNFLKER